VAARDKPLCTYIYLLFIPLGRTSNFIILRYACIEPRWPIQSLSKLQSFQHEIKSSLLLFKLDFNIPSYPSRRGPFFPDWAGMLWLCLHEWYRERPRLCGNGLQWHGHRLSVHLSDLPDAQDSLTDKLTSKACVRRSKCHLEHHAVAQSGQIKQYPWEKTRSRRILRNW